MNKSGLIKTIVLILFFSLGLLISFLFQRKKADDKESEQIEQVEQVEQKSEAVVWEEQELNASGFGAEQTSSIPAGKFTIVEAQKISADKTNVQTGEDVRFWLTIKNDGAKVKTLTHLCFNHSGGTTFGCLLDHTLASGQEFSISNTTRFYSPGVYSVWFTWSQDKTNFYKPVNGSSVKVVVE